MFDIGCWLWLKVQSCCRLASGEGRPSGPVILLAVGAGEGGDVFDSALERAVGLGGVRDAAADGAGFEVPDVLPA